MLKESLCPVLAFQKVGRLNYAVLSKRCKVVTALIDSGADLQAMDKESNTALHHAAQHGLLSIAELLVGKGAEVDCRNERSLTPLHVAARWGHGNVIELLLRENADPLAKDVNGQTPMHYAVGMNHLGAVIRIINNCVKAKFVDMINAENNYKETILHKVAERGNKDVLDVILMFKPRRLEINVRDEKGNAPLHSAVKGGNLHSIERLIEEGAEIDAINKSGSTPIILAAILMNADAFKLLFDKHADFNKADDDGYTPFEIACIRGDIDILKILIKKCDVNKVRMEHHIEEIERTELSMFYDLVFFKNTIVENTPLRTAITQKYTGVVKLLIENGAIIDEDHLCIATCAGSNDIVELLVKNNKTLVKSTGKEDLTFLHLAASNGFTKVALTLIENGAIIDAVNENGMTPLHMAANSGHYEIVDMLLSRGANVHQTDDVMNSPLHLASSADHADVVQRLLTAGADIHVRNKHGKTPIQMSAKAGLNVLRILLTRCNTAIEDIRDQNDWTLLHYASLHGNLEMIQYLVSQGLNTNAREKLKGAQPIHFAAGFGHIDAVKFFIAQGLSINACNSEGNSLLHYAAMRNEIRCGIYLIQNGAELESRSNDGSTPLSFARKYEFEEFAQMLTNKGATQ